MCNTAEARATFADTQTLWCAYERMSSERTAANQTSVSVWFGLARSGNGTFKETLRTWTRFPCELTVRLFNVHAPLRARERIPPTIRAASRDVARSHVSRDTCAVRVGKFYYTRGHPSPFQAADYFYLLHRRSRTAYDIPARILRRTRREYTFAL